MSVPNVKVIYDGGYVRDLGIVTEGTMQGWLVYRHPDGQWITLADLVPHLELLVTMESPENQA